MNSQQPDMTALISSRICHDLSSPLGAINNGVELLGGFGAAASPEMELIAQSVLSANAKMRYFRIAFGNAGANAEMQASELGSLCESMFSNGRMKVSFQTGIGDLPQRDGKLILLLILCLETTLPLGGSVVVGRDTSGWHLTGTGKRISANPDLWSLLNGRQAVDLVKPSQVQFAVAHDALEKIRCRLDTEFGSTQAIVRIVQTG